MSQDKKLVSFHMRRPGKTIDLINRAILKNATIICATEQEAARLHKLAREHFNKKINTGVLSND